MLQKYDRGFHLFILHILYKQVAEEVSKIPGVSKVLLADNEAFKGFLPGKYQLNDLKPKVIFIL